MPSTVLPQTTLASEFAAFPAAVTETIAPLIMGPQAGLHRFNVPAEQLTIDVGEYNPSADTSYNYPGADPTSIIDQAYIEVWVEDALLQYYDHEVGNSPTLAPVSGYSNRIRSAGTAFADNGPNYPHNSTLFLDRGVKIGDIIDVTGTVASTTYSLRSSVYGFVGEVIGAQTAAGVPGASNAANSVLGAQSTQTAGCTNYIDGVNTVSATSYNGISTGNLAETYTVSVIQAPTVPGNATTALLSVLSASGNDNVASFAPAAYASPTAIGDRGATITFHVNNTLPVTCGVQADFVVGQTWTYAVSEAYTKGTMVSSGTYTGTQDTTYIITCVLGGRFADAVKPQIKITTSTGVDYSGPISVTSAASIVPIGSLGVMAQFGGYSGLDYGDTWSIPVLAQSAGAYQTIVLANNLASGVLAATDLRVKLYIDDIIQVPEERVSAPGVFNYTTSPTELTLNSGLLAYDSTWTSNGVQEPLPVVSGIVYIQFREWFQNIVGFVLPVVTNADIVSTCGVIDPANPIAWGASKAVLNANGATVYVCAVADMATQSSWSDGLAAIANVGTIYNIAPMTSDPAIGLLFQAHVDTQSAVPPGLSRVAWLNLTANTFVPWITSANTTNKATALGTLTAVPGDPVGVYRLLTCTSANANFVTNGVRPGDTVEYLFTTDPWGNVTWTNFIVQSVVNEDELIVVSGVSSAISVPQMFEIWRTYTNDEMTSDLIAQAAVYNDPRVRCVWPDQADSLPGYYVCAALAGEASGVCSNQGLRNTQLVGFTDLSRSLAFLTAGNIVSLTQNSIWVVSQDPFGINYSMSAVTSANKSEVIQNTQEMIVRNSDAINFYAIASCATLIGSSNVVVGTISAVSSTIQSALNILMSRGINTRLGQALLTYTINNVSVSVVALDQIIVTITYTLPAPLDTVTVISTIVI